MPETWVEIGNIIGPAGPPGVIGPPGPLPSDSVLVRNFFFQGRSAAGIEIGKTPGYWTSKVQGLITAWDLTVDVGTIALKIWKIAAGLGHPTAANSINTAGIALTTGTATGLVLDLSDFLTLDVAIGDIFAAQVVAVGGGVKDFGGSISITAADESGGGSIPGIDHIGEVPTAVDTDGNYTTAANFDDDSLAVYVNGLRMTQTSDFLITGANTFRLLIPPVTGDSVSVDYYETETL